MKSVKSHVCSVKILLGHVEFSVYGGQVEIECKPVGFKTKVQWGARYRAGTGWVINGKVIDYPEIVAKLDDELCKESTKAIHHVKGAVELFQGKLEVELDVPEQTPEPPPTPPPPPPKPPEPPPVETAATVTSTEPKVGQVFRAAVSQCVPFQMDQSDPEILGQPRTYFDPIETARLMESMRKFGQEAPIEVRPIKGVPGKAFEIISGETRWRVASGLGWTHLDAVVGKPGTRAELYQRAFVLNIGGTCHTYMEQSNFLAVMAKRGMTIADMALLIKKSHAQVSNLLLLQKLHSDLKLLVDPPTPISDRISVQIGAVLAKIALEKQVEIWNEAKKQPTKALVVAALHELGRLHVVLKRKGNHRHNPKRDVERVVSRTRNVQKAVMNFAGLLPSEWDAFVKVKGKDGTIELKRRLVELESGLQDIRQQLIRAQTRAGRNGSDGDSETQK